MGSAPMVSLSSHAAPRSPFSFVGRAGRAARALTTVASALALAAGVLALAPAPAHADGAVPSQEYFSYYPLNTVHQKGITGKGVTIAVIDGPVDTSNPALKGANITDKSRCTIQDSPEGVRHATEMATILVSPISGVAPDATLYSYQAATSQSISGGTCASSGESLDSFGKLINQAIEDGAQIISISQGGLPDRSDEIKWAIANAITHGVIVTASVGNEARDQNDTHLSFWPGVVGVSAINGDGTFASYSSWGDGVVTAAFGGPYTTYDVNTGEPVTVHGTSISAPLVAGMLALARQKWPDATTNQILQLLVHTGLNPNHDWNKYTGYGAAALGSLVNQDPSQYPDENPIIEKQGTGTSLSPQDIRDYADGVANSTDAQSFPASYVYRGADEGILFDQDRTIAVHLGTSPRYHRK